MAVIAKAPPYKRGDRVYYDNGRGLTFRATVRKLHRDGSLSVEPAFTVNAAGNDMGIYQGGHLVRLDAGDVRVSARQ